MTADNTHASVPANIMRIGLTTLIAAVVVFAYDATAREVQYEYDSLSRLTRVIYDSCTTVEYDYDAAGNITATRTLVDNSADDDCDDVPDGSDSCPATPAGAIVDAQGCAVEQGCPCAGPLGGGSWASHGAYVTCVAGVADDLLGAGVITSADRDAIIADADDSNCGGGNSVPDLVGDPANTDACQAVVIDVLANDSDVEDGAGANLSITGVSSGSLGTAVIFDDGGIDKILYTPDTGLAGVENLVYTAQDSGGASADATLVITVHPTGDSDGDGVQDACDNCLAVLNTDQRDTDGDNIGNACDADITNDCLVNFPDLSIYRANFFAAGDLHTDNNGDGLTNFADLAVVRSMFFGPPGPSALGCN